jgi:large subunit ribosomal protein L7Ae
MSPVTGSTTTTKKTTTAKTATTTKPSSTTGKTTSGAPKKGKKKIAAAPFKAKVESKKLVNPLYEKRPKNFGIGQGKKKTNSQTKLLFIFI